MSRVCGTPRYSDPPLGEAGGGGRHTAPHPRQWPQQRSTCQSTPVSRLVARPRRIPARHTFTPGAIHSRQALYIHARPSRESLLKVGIHWARHCTVYNVIQLYAIRYKSGIYHRGHYIAGIRHNTLGNGALHNMIDWGTVG